MNSEPGKSTNEQTTPSQPPSPSAAINPEPPKPTIVDIKTEVINIKAKQATINATQASQQQQDPEKRLEDRIKKSDRLMILLTGVIALVGVLTWVEIHNGGITTAAQTDRIIEADDSLASATEASNRNSESALRRSLAESERVLSANIDASRNDLRAWVAALGITGVPALNQPWIVHIVAKNSGKTFAKRFRMQVRIARTVPPVTEPGFDDRMEAARSVSVLAPNGEYTSDTTVTGDNSDPHLPNPSQADLDAIRHTVVRFFAYGRMEYRDVFRVPHWTTFCFALTTNLAWESCSTHNDADDNEPKQAN